jgi:hypothetical protein
MQARLVGYLTHRGTNVVSDKTQDTSAKPPDKAPDQQSPLVDAGRVAVTYTAVPPKGPPGKEIHPRRPLPAVPPKPQSGPADKD